MTSTNKSAHFDDQDCLDEDLLDNDWNDGDVKAGHDSYLTPHQVSKGMIPWWRTWRKERWLNFFLSTKKTESHLDQERPSHGGGSTMDKSHMSRILEA